MLGTVITIKMYTPTVISLLLTCPVAKSKAAAWQANYPNRQAKDVFGDNDFHKLQQLTNNIAKVVGKKSRSVIILYGKVMKNVKRRKDTIANRASLHKPHTANCKPQTANRKPQTANRKPL
jgi:hypothetical protein